MMKKFLLFLLMIMNFYSYSQKTYEAEWKSVDSLNSMGQPRSALSIVNHICQETRSDNNAAQFVKASIYRMSLSSSFEENSLEESIKATLSDLKTAKAPVKNILHSLLGELYWNYYSQNQYRILNRSSITNDTQEDISTWDLRKIVAACVDQYNASLGNPEMLKQVPVNVFDAILLGKPESRNYRPTLFDFLAHRSADFFMNSEAGITQPASRFLVDQAVYFGPALQFSTLKIETIDSLSFDFQAVKILREITAFHQNDKDPLALIDVELKRLGYIHRLCILPEKDSLYLSALNRLLKDYPDIPASAEVIAAIAGQLVTNGGKYQPLSSEAHKWDLKKAFDLASDAVKRFPDTYGARQCEVLIGQLKQPNLDITTDYASVAGKASLASVSFRNTAKLFLRLYKADPEEEKRMINSSNDAPFKMYLSREPVLTWEQPLPSDGDFQMHRTEIRIPSTVAGYYVLLACADESFPEQSLISLNRFWRTSISYVSRRTDTGSYDLYVLDRDEGQPLKDIRIQSFFREYDYRNRQYIDRPGSIFVSNENGFVNIPAHNSEPYYQYYLVFTGGKDKFITESYFSGYPNNYNPPKAYTNTYFFTDRSIYRPGQTVYFKGISLERRGKETRIKAGYRTTVTFYDVNGQKVSSQDVTSNEFGSFSGAFTAPSGSLTGAMSLQCETGSVSVQVEEYKRPKFEVTFNPVKGSYKLGEEVTVSGKAAAYSGSNIGAAALTYRVVRSARFPYMWWGWREWIPQSAEMEIVNGSAETAEDGSFSIRFTAIPDFTLETKYNPVFTYRVYADVTDINGETHSGEKAVSVGNQALLIVEDIPEKVNLDSLFRISLSTTNLNGEKEAASGTLRIWKLHDPDKVFRNRTWPRPDTFVMTPSEFGKEFPNDLYNNENDVQQLEKEIQVYNGQFNTATDSLLTLNGSAGWKPGKYLYTLETKDIFGQKVEKTGSFIAYSTSSKQMPAKEVAWFSISKTTAEPGESIILVTGTAAKNSRMIVEILQNEKIISRELIPVSQNQVMKMIRVEESYRGNFTINVAIVKMNRSWQFTQKIEVPWTNRKLDIRFASFRSKLLPGQEEEWQITVSGPKGDKAAAEMLAGMYDASLDAFIPHSWNFNIFNYFNTVYLWDITSAFGNRSSIISRYPDPPSVLNEREYDQLNWFGFSMYRGYPRGGLKGFQSLAADASMAAPNAADEVMYSKEPRQSEESTRETPAKGEPPVTEKQASVVQPAKVRKDFNETAFFYPQLKTNEKGEVVIRFTIPESLTRWKMMGLAYTKDLSVGQVEKTLVTQKDLMVFPNAPRFLRENDQMVFSVKVSNTGKEIATGSAELHFFDAYTMQPLDKEILRGNSASGFEVKSGGSTVLNWQIMVPEGLQAVVYRVTASSGTFTDGEEAVIPVLTNRMLVTESLPLPVNGNQTKSFSFRKLVDSGKPGESLTNYRLTLEYTSNPAWYAVQALPYLMEYPYECAEQVFSRFYANSLASYIANSNPRIKAVFESWKNISPDALKSNLEKNQELKNILLEESPWVREAANEQERKQRIAILFDLNRMSNELNAALKKLADMQAPNGGWPWFAGMPDNRYITQHIVTGLGHLDHLGVKNYEGNPQLSRMLRSAIYYLDARLSEDLEKIKKEDKDYLKNNHLGYEQVQYMYARSYFLIGFPLEKKDLEAYGYFKEQAVQYWKAQNPYLKGMIALALNRVGEEKTARLIMRSLSETALHNEEMGMYWRPEARGWFWYQAPVETQSLMIEAFDEVLNDSRSVEEMKVWLLKQKQTQDWKTTKATTEAIYALLLKGTDLLASSQLVSIKAGDQVVDPYKTDNGTRPEAGTGYFKTSWSGKEIKPEMGKITVTNPNPTVAWGAMYWQYFEQLDKITPAETPLSLEKKLFREVNSSTGPVLEPVEGATVLKTGDKVVVRVILRSDRDMEYVHLKDMRASSFEPVNVLSGYRWQDGLGYYESTRDASSNFFISYLPKGTYVFEYRLFATQKGDFSNGITTVQCMYAPEFSAHSEGTRLRVE